MPQKERAEPARPVRDRRWSDSQSIGPERWNSNPRPSTDLTTVTEAFLSCDQSTWQVKGLQQIHLGSSRQAIAGTISRHIICSGQLFAQFFRSHPEELPEAQRGQLQAQQAVRRLILSVPGPELV